MSTTDQGLAALVGAETQNGTGTTSFVFFSLLFLGLVLVGKRFAAPKSPRVMTSAESRKRFRELKRLGCEPKRVKLPDGTLVVLRKKGCP